MPGQLVCQDCQDITSVGTEIKISHIAASPIGAEVTAIATIDYVFGRRIEFSITALDSAGEIGNGKHTRIIVDANRFLEKVKIRKPKDMGYGD